jgi:hypothetical protein
VLDSALSRVRFGAVTTLLPRRINRSIARLLLGVVLFMQMLTAVHACTPTQREAAFAHLSHPQVHAGMVCCHHQGTADAASCVAHCSAANQNVDTHNVAWVGTPTIAILTVPVPADPAICNSTNRPTRRVASGDPPIAIRFQVFRI